MSYWVLENRKGGYAKIHLAHCHTCNNGHGPKPDNNGNGHGNNGNGSWKGPFSCFNDAVTWAKSARRYVDPCKFCKPESD